MSGGMGIPPPDWGNFKTKFLLNSKGWREKSLEV